MKTPNELKNWRFWVRNGDFQEFFGIFQQASNEGLRIEVSEQA